MSWQQKCTAHLLAERANWVRLGDLFKEAEYQIPMHKALRHIANKRYRIPEGEYPVELARWVFFVNQIRMKIERRSADGRPLLRAFQRDDLVRLKPHPVPCGKCGGPRLPEVSSRSGIRRVYTCLQCVDEPVDKPEPVEPEVVEVAPEAIEPEPIEPEPIEPELVEAAPEAEPVEFSSLKPMMLGPSDRMLRGNLNINGHSVNNILIPKGSQDANDGVFQIADGFEEAWQRFIAFPPHRSTMLRKKSWIYRHARTAFKTGAEDLIDRVKRDRRAESKLLNSGGGLGGALVQMLGVFYLRAAIWVNQHHPNKPWSGALAEAFVEGSITMYFYIVGRIEDEAVEDLKEFSVRRRDFDTKEQIRAFEARENELRR